MSDLERVERRLSDLEYRLEQYLEAQKQALDYQAQFQLNATWGIVRSTSSFVFFGAPGFVAYYIAKWAGVDNWLIWLVGFVIGLVAWYFYAGHVERGYDGDVKKLGELPEPPQFPGWRN